MKIRKYLSLVIFNLILGTGPVFSFGNDVLNIQLQPQFGILHGAVNEYVFEDAIRNTNHLESRLDWDLNAVPYFELSVDLSLLKYAHLGVNGRIGIPTACGYMQDYDWLNSVTTDWKGDDPTELTNYSKHDNFLTEYYDFSIEAGGIIPIKEFVYITPMVSYEYNYIQFRGSNGYRRYKEDDFREVSFSGDVICYALESNIVKFGMRFDIIPVKFLNIKASIFYSPFTSYINALDRHLVADTGRGYPYGKAFWDKIEYSSNFQTNISIEYVFTKTHKLGLNCGFEFVPTHTGTDYMKALDSSYNPNKSKKWTKTAAHGGVSYYLWNWSILYTLSF